MPELPEVETVVRLIRPRILGRRVRAVLVRWSRTLGGQRRRDFEQGVLGARFAGAWRRGKHFVLELERRGRPAGALVGHLRMTGRLEVLEQGAEPGPWARVVLALDDRRSLVFQDVRKFGRLVYRARPADAFEALGPEPLEAGFDADWLYAALRSRRRALKPLLLDQAFVAGLGNIYVDESLHRAGLHPTTPSQGLGRARAERLCAAIRAVLSAAILREGSSFDAFYRTPEGKPGGYQDELGVYGREGEPCRSCGSAIVRIVVGQRGTWLCPRCQPAPRKRRKAAAGRASRG